MLSGGCVVNFRISYSFIPFYIKSNIAKNENCHTYCSRVIEDIPNVLANKTKVSDKKDVHFL